MSYELDGDLLIASALLGLDDLTFAELGMEDRLSWFVRDREHLRHGRGGASAANFVAQTACRPGAERAAGRCSEGTMAAQAAGERLLAQRIVSLHDLNRPALRLIKAGLTTTFGVRAAAP